ncbi:MAG: hemerythrin family protein [Thiohalophilus sp.]|uniref:hemerythrin family protein n=1 Tax=Thiohalophilus sp. TaxID=3028392 RepID=UPI002870A09F|nr:hemerythrin family protein [Thiohalophilus sp.]MDR9435955.1 hemerythrin family protein [Thiohalophilus sp.]
MQRNLAQKISLVIAVLCYLAAAGFTIAALVYEPRQSGDPIHASFMASVIFFIGCGIVLHVIARTRLKGLVSLSAEEEHRD